MKKLILLMLLFLISTFPLAMADTEGGVDKENESDFSCVIGPGDVLQINVWRHPDLSMQVKVGPDGKIAFPLVDELKVADFTAIALKKDLAKRLGRIIRDPEVTVNIVGFESRKIFVLGEVNRPGIYPFEGREHVLEAISKAGGYKEGTAALKSIIVIKRGSSAHPQAVRANILDLLKKGDARQDLALHAGDIVFVPKTFIANINTFIDQFFTKTDPVLKYYLDIYNIKNPGVLGQ